MPSAGQKYATTTELFHNDVPVLRTSLVRHGLVESYGSPRTIRLPVEPQSSEDLKAADEEDAGWTEAGGLEEEDVAKEACSREGARMESEDAGLRALVEVNGVVIGHARAAEELRRALLSSPKESSRSPPPPPPRSPPRTSSLSGTASARTANAGAGNMKPQRSTDLAGAVASAALAAARRGGGRVVDRGVLVGAGFPGGALGGVMYEGPSTAAQPSVSRASVMNIAAHLLGSAGRGNGGNGNGNGKRAGTAGGNGNIRRKGGDGHGSTYASGHRRSVSSHNRSSARAASVQKDEGMVTFTVDVHTGGSLTLGIGVKELGGGCVVVEDLHRPPGDPPGPAERAGVAIGDVILGINYEPLERGLVHTADLLAGAIKVAGFVKLQISRAVMGGSGVSKWRQPLPGRDSPIVTELMWRAAQLRRAGVLSSSERNVINGIILKRMAWEEGLCMGPLEPPRMPAPLSMLTTAPVPLLLKRAASSQLDSMVLQVKGLREALFVRCLYAKSTVEPTKVSLVWSPPAGGEGERPKRLAGAVEAPSRVSERYVLRAEDVATGREWLVFPRYLDFSKLYKELLDMWPPIADVPFPTKRPVSSLLPDASAVEERIVALEAFLHGALSLLGVYAAVDPRSPECLRLIQDFLGMPKDLFTADAAMLPARFEQKRVELLVYKLLNQVDSPASRMKHRLMRDFERDVSNAPDVESMMKRTASRLRSLKDFILEQHEQQLLVCVETVNSPASGSREAKRATMRKAVRRQVELSLYLPLRRCLWRELAFRLKGPARHLQRAIKALRQSPPSVFGVEAPGVFAASEWGPAMEAVGQATRRVLPTDQIEGLRRAAEHIAALHSSLVRVTAGADEVPANGTKPLLPLDNPFGDDDPGRSGTDDDHFGSWVGAREDAFYLRDPIDDGSRGSFSRGGGCADLMSSSDRNVRFRRSVSPTDAFGAGGVADAEEGHRANANGSSTRRHRRGRSAPEGAETKKELEVYREDRPRTVIEFQPVESSEGIGKVATSASASQSLNFVGEGNASSAEDDDERSRCRQGEARVADKARVNGKGAEMIMIEASLTLQPGSETTGRCWRPSSNSTEISPPSPRSRIGSSSSSTWDSIGDASVFAEEMEGDSVRIGGVDFDIDAARHVASMGGVGDKERLATRAAAGGKASRTRNEDVMGADDFLPLFALALVNSAPLDLLLPQTLLTHLMDAEGSLSEAGYLVATLEATVSFITQVYDSSCCSGGGRGSQLQDNFNGRS